VVVLLGERFVAQGDRTFPCGAPDCFNSIFYPLNLCEVLVAKHLEISPLGKRQGSGRGL